jgi:hypothetical protein
MTDDKNTQLIKTFKNMILDFGMPKTPEDIADPDFRSAATAHLDEFEEARSECESELTLR